MPLYEYQCDACGHVFEKLQKRGAEAPSECPECGESGQVRRAISTTAFHLKGGGWYVTDYKTKSGSPKGESSPASSSTSSSSDSSESSPKDASSTSPSEAS